VTDREKIEAICEKRPRGARDALIPLMQDVQEEYGYLPREAVILIGRYLGVPISKVFGVATFYNQFLLQPPGRYHVQICRGTACHVKGSVSILERLVHILKIEPGQTTRDGLFSLEVVACIGACGLSPVISVNGEFHARVTPDSVEEIIESYRRKTAADDGQAA